MFFQGLVSKFVKDRVKEYGCNRIKARGRPGVLNFFKSFFLFTSLTIVLLVRAIVAFLVIYLKSSLLGEQEETDNFEVSLLLTYDAITEI